MTKQELQIELTATTETLESTNKSLEINREYTEGLQEEKAWHTEQYCLMRRERDCLEKQIELEHELIETKAALKKAKKRRIKIDREYMESIEPARLEKKARRQQANQ